MPLAAGAGRTLPPTVTIEDLQNQIIARQPVLVAIRDFDEATGIPRADGPISHSHWVVLTGFATDPDTGRRYVIALHGLSDGPVVWPLEAFEASWDAPYRATVIVAPPVRR